ncbi:MAG: MFS transporter [Alphaproteobacteria bacterium]|nr:MFS transporter [Alphaproteobacteria bacterium]
MTASAANAAPDSTRWLAVWAMVAVGALSAIQVGKVGPALPLIRPDLDLGLVPGGWIASIINLTGAVIGIPAGIVADRLGHRQVIVAGILCLLLGSLGGALAPSGTVLLASRFFEGVGYGAIVVAGTPMVVEATSERSRRFALGVWSAYFPMGMIAMLLSASYVLEHHGWRPFWGMNVVLCGAVLVLFLRATHSNGAGATLARWRDVGIALTGAGPWLLAAILLVKSFASFSIMTWMPTLWIDQMQRSVFGAAMLTAVFIAIFIPANILGGTLIRVRGIRAWHLIVVAGLGIALFPQGIFADDLPLAVRLPLLMVYAATAGLIPGVIFASIPAHSPTSAQIGAVTGLIVQCASTGNLIGPPILAAIVVAFGGWSEVKILYVGLGGLIMVGALALRAVERRAPT